MIKNSGHLKKRAMTFFLIFVMLSSTVFVVITFNSDNVEAANLDHTVGNVDIKYLTDFGRILQTINWGPPQVAKDSGGFGFIGLVIDQDNYDHTPGAENVADSFLAFPYASSDDFKAQKPISFVIDDGTTQKSFGTFQNSGTGTGDPYDIYVNQTVWTVAGEDFAIFQYRLTNIKAPAADLTNVCIGLEIPFSKDGSRFGVGGEILDSGDDVDGYDGANDIYWVRDLDTGTTVGVGSAISSDPMNHYFAKDYQMDYNSEYKYTFENESWLYERLHAPSAVATDGVTPQNITTTLGWNGITIPAGGSRTFTYLVAVNNSQVNMVSAIAKGRSYYHNVATRFQISEFSDSEAGPAKIEVYNEGRPATAVSELSLSGNFGPFTGSWSVDPIPQYGYSVFTVNENIDAQGDTIVLYQNLNPIDSVSFGQDGIAPDPVSGESTARHYDPGLMGYGDSWLHNASSGPSWGSENDVPGVSSGSSFMMNEIMFNPSTSDGGFIELINTHSVSDINLRNFQLVCNDRYRLPDTDIWLGPGEKFQLVYTDAQTFFDNMISSGDNIYLYNDNDNLYDMMGWSTSHLLGMSALRVPDGFGTYQGYDDATSEAAGWVFNTPNKVLITEISDSGSATSQIEVYNPKYPVIDFNTGFTLSSQSGPLTGIWSQAIANSGEYGIFDVSPPGLDIDGDSVGLYQNGILVEEVFYGTKGTVPDPLDDESVQRIWTGSSYIDVWERNWTTGPNFGFENNVPKSNLSTAVVLNEVVFNPSVPGNHFVELYFRFIMPVDISGYKIVGDSEYIVPQGTILNLNETFFYLQYSDAPWFFDPDMDHNGDNVYLYDRNGSIMDMVGWSSPHTVDTSVCRVPDGNGTSDGYDDITSVIAEWQFDCIPTISLIKVDVPPDNKTAKFGDLGEWVSFNLTIWNFQSVSDTLTFDIATQEGWPVEIWDEMETMIISDVTLGPDDTVNIVLKIKLPDVYNFIVEDNVTITVESSNSDMIRDMILLKGKIAPFVIVSKRAELTDINILGTGFNEQTTINLSALGTGAIMEGEGSNAADIVFVVDDTGSMGPYLDSMKIEIQNIVQVFSDEITSLRLGLVSYKDNPELDCNLTENMTLFINAVNMLTPAAGGDPEEDVYGGLDMAINLWWRTGDVSKIIILIGDQPDHFPYDDCDALVKAAHKDEWGIYTNAIACGPDPLTIQTFTNIADNGSGIFYNYQGFMDPDALAQAIIESVLTFVPEIDVAAKDSVITDDIRMIQDVLPPYIDYVPGSFSIPPTEITVDGFGNTILEWNVDNIKIGENWTVNFNITSTLEGMQLANVVSDSRVSYTMWNNTNTTKLFPEVWINVIAIPVPPPIPPPPEPRISVIPGTNHTLLEWTPPGLIDADHYLIYRSLDRPNTFDFSTPWINTSSDMDPIGSNILGTRTSWNFTDDVINATEIYYCMRTVDTISQISNTSITVGKWTRVFAQNTSTFSIPLETIDPMTADEYLADMGALYLMWMNTTTGTWMKHGDGDWNDRTLRQGEGYLVNFASPSTYTFCGMPGAMIVSETISPYGFDPNFDSSSLNASVDSEGNVKLEWNRTDTMDPGDNYLIYRASERTGFHDGTAQLVANISYGVEIWTDFGAAASESQWYYMIVPENELGERGTTTYSIGVWTEDFSGAFDTFGMALSTSLSLTLDWYCDGITNSVGMNYYQESVQRWGWHSTAMPPGAFDTVVTMGEGYQISISAPTRFTFIGV
jgi:hypothetical protein